MDTTQKEMSVNEASTCVLIKTDSQLVNNCEEKDHQAGFRSEVVEGSGEVNVVKVEATSEMDTAETKSDRNIEVMELDVGKETAAPKESDSSNSKLDFAVTPNLEHEAVFSLNLLNNIKTEKTDDHVDIRTNVNALSSTANPTESSTKSDEESKVDISNHGEIDCEVTYITSTGGASLVVYSSSEEESGSEESSSCSSTSDSDSTEHDSDSTEQETEEMKAVVKTEGENPSFIPEPLKTKKEVMLQDLPAVPFVDYRLADDEEVNLLGKVSSIIGQLVVVSSNTDTPALNEETVLFGENRHPIGVVFELFGPVSNPFYTVRFNSAKEITDLGLSLNADVYFAPKQEEITKYVFVRELRAMKGSDASWANDEEPPRECLDYSDDEQERNAKKKKALEKGKRKDARRKEESNQQGDQDGNSPRPVTSGQGQGHTNSRGDHHQSRGASRGHYNQQHSSQSERGPPGQYPRYPQPQGSDRRHRPEWQQGVHHPPPNGNFYQMPFNSPNYQSNIAPSHFHNSSPGYGPPPPNMYSNFQGGPMHASPPPMSPYAAPPPFFLPPVNAPPPGMPQGMPSGIQGTHQRPY
ncbi:putative H/ACA ribonucleoprotein complex [Apostichopus japonicus]|uniref:H/ACA ribonucleoprotein complex non-core subunit NAF1 n=1 Tax=Stichopus japonicus TaxID=307972 RepID=A0A2G8K5H7_STIJA|nr:putative H/ACA ribonucleoprotein complex [Apostichopus japonicus]